MPLSDCPYKRTIVKGLILQLVSQDQNRYFFLRLDTAITVLVVHFNLLWLALEKGRKPYLVVRVFCVDIWWTPKTTKPAQGGLSL